MLSYAQKEEAVPVHGKYEYRITMDGEISPKDAKAICLEQARLAAIAEKFGTTISSTVTQNNETHNNRFTTNFKEYTSQTVKGRWIKDTKEPVFSDDHKDGIWTIRCEVWGLARSVNGSKQDMHWNILAGTPDINNVSDTFNNNQHLFIDFKTSQNGYVAVYLIEEKVKKVSRLLPYERDLDGRFDVKSGIPYILFDRDADQKRYPGLIKLFTKDAVEYNTVVLLFSPNPISKCYMEKGGKKEEPESIDQSYFEQWLMTCQNEDDELIVEKKRIKICNNKIK